MDVRLLIDGPAAGAWNMAVDDALLESVSRGGQACLRFYQWESATQSLGYFQAAAERQVHPPSLDLPWVRRATGGGALVHHHDLTYSFVAPQAVRADAQVWYDLAHRGLMAVLAEEGWAATWNSADARPWAESARQPFLCFQRRAAGDVLLDGWKICGSAQRKKLGAVLQHGSLLLARSAHAPELLGLADLTPLAPLDTLHLATRWAGSMANRRGWRLFPSQLSGVEVDCAVKFQFGRYAADAWSHRR